MAGANTKDIKRRIKSVESTMQITKAMELVASSKLRKAKERVETARPFFDMLYETMRDAAISNRDFSSTYVAKREVKKSAFVVIAGDRGLAGGYNANVLKYATQLSIFPAAATNFTPRSTTRRRPFIWKMPMTSPRCSPPCTARGKLMRSASCTPVLSRC